MDSILRILGNTPVWVFALFAYLAWQGVQSLRPRVLPVWRVLMAPMVFVLMGVSRILLGRADGQWPIIAWAVAAVALAGGGTGRRPRVGGGGPGRRAGVASGKSDAADPQCHRVWVAVRDRRHGRPASG